MTPEELSQVLKSAYDTILVVDPDHRIVYINRTILPRTAEEVVGASVYHFLHPESHAPVRACLDRIFSGGESEELETRTFRADGRVAYWLGRISPVLEKGRVVRAVVLAADTTERRLAEIELTLAQSELRSFSAGLQAAQEAERLRIARELHDGLGQLLTALRTELGWMEERLVGQDELLERSRSMAELVTRTIQSVREIATQLRPAILDDLGLGAALDWLAQETLSRSRQSYTLSCNLEGVDLDPRVSLCLFRICQEALTNVVRHARASRVDISLEADEERARLVVRDDGRGLPPGNHRRAVSLGLMSMRERALMLGGRTDVHGPPGEGTRVEVLIPLKGLGSHGQGHPELD